MYLAGKIVDGKMCVHMINSYENAFDFCDGTKKFHEDLGYNYDIEILCILGIKEKVEKIGNIIENEIKNNFNRIINRENILYQHEELDNLGNNFNRTVQECIFSPKLKYPRKDRIEKGAYIIEYFMLCDDKNDKRHLYTEEVIDIFMELEFPLIMGKQLMIKSFELSDLNGRKIIGIFSEDNSWNLVLEGGFKLELNSETPYVRQILGMNNLEQFTTRQADTIIINPVYAYGKNYYPTEIYSEWHKVFLYAMALTQSPLLFENMLEKYEKFLNFIEENICNVMEFPTTITKGEYQQALCVCIMQLKDFLKGKEEAIISNYLLLLLNTRYVYLPYIYEIIGFPISNNIKFDIIEFQEKIKALEVKNSYQKGLNLEELASYFINNIEGLQISGKRVKTEYGEIDLSAVNTSLDNNLWKMGAYILIECKNWKERVDIKVIRGLSHISQLKGNKTAILFSINGLTKDAEEELIRTALNGSFILSITKEDLYDVKSKEDCYNLLVNKWNRLNQIVSEHLNI